MKITIESLDNTYSATIGEGGPMIGDAIDMFCRLCVAVGYNWESVKEAIGELNDEYNHENNTAGD